LQKFKERCSVGNEPGSGRQSTREVPKVRYTLKKEMKILF
jgi:hypothetical protein